MTEPAIVWWKWFSRLSKLKNEVRVISLRYVTLLTDEDFNNRILRGVLRRQPQLDILRVQDVLTREERDDDRKVLEWAAAERRVLLTHDVTTMRPYAEARVAAGLPMPGVFEISQYLPIGQAVEEILLLAECSLEGEWEGQIRFLPLK